MIRLRTSDLKWRDLDGEIVALDRSESLYLGTNPAGTLLWRLLSDGATRDGLTDALVAEFSIDVERARADVDAFVAQLDTRGLLESP